MDGRSEQRRCRWVSIHRCVGGRRRSSSDALATDIERGDVVLVQARRLGTLVGWVTLRSNPSRLTSHWATIERLQSHPSQRGTGVGVALLQRATDHARNAGLEQLRLFLRCGMGLEEFYQRQGWVEIGRHRDALRFPDGDRDEVSMAIDLRSNLVDPIAEAGLTTRVRHSGERVVAGVQTNSWQVMYSARV